LSQLGDTGRDIRDSEVENNARETRVIKPGDTARHAIQSFIEKAATGDSPFVGSITDKLNPAMAQRLLGTIGQIKATKADLVAEYITDIQKDNVEDVKRLIKAGIVVRHLEGNKIGFSVSGKEYLNHFQETGEAAQGDDESDRTELLYSNNPDLVMQMRQLFEVLWKSALPAQSRIKQLELGLESGETRIITDLNDSVALGWELMNGVKHDIEIILATSKTLERNAQMYREMLKLARSRGVRIRIIGPPLENQVEAFDGFEWRTTTPMATGLAIYDGKSMLITQYVDPEAGSGKEAFLSNIYSTDRRTISGMMSLFDAIWNESGMRREESRERTQAQLLQDILTHDIRNYNQIALTSTELLAEHLSGDQEAQVHLDRTMKAIRGSTELLEKASRLGKILSLPEPSLHSVDLRSCITDSLQLVRDSRPDKNINHEMRVGTGAGRGLSEAPALADELLGEAFVNIYSNCVAYTDGNDVPIETLVEEVEEERGGKSTRLWRVSISDHGRGVPDDLKGNFTRYRSSPQGKGLGLSIVHALVVDRYSGGLLIKNRVQEDYRAGACVQLLIPKAMP
jgi:two-component system sensor histidine kinase VicK